MLIDTTRQVPENLLQFDVCIVGSGPAGITLAREISNSGLRVCLLESGGHNLARAAQNLNTGVVDSPQGYGEQFLREGRRRQFGGTANLWNHEVRGHSGRHIRYLALDEIDFECRGWVPESGWPFSRRELEPFYERAQQVCGIGKLNDRVEAWEAGKESTGPWQTEKIESVACLFGSSKIFLKDYRKELARSKRISVLLHTTVVGLMMNRLSRAITSVKAATPDGRTFQIRAEAFVLACGGLENARLLLLQNALQPGGLGNQHDMVGRCFMDHPALTIGTLIPASRTIFAQTRVYDQHVEGGQDTMYILRLRSKVMRAEKMLNLGAVLVPHFRNFRANSPAIIHQLLVRTPRYLLRHLSPALRSHLQNGGEPPQPLRQRLLEQYYSQGQCGWSRLGKLDHRFAAFAIQALVEQAPDRSNRIVLGEGTDAFGQPKIKVLWRWNELDLHSIRAAQLIIREQLASAGIGTFVPVEEALSPPFRRFISPHHFLGTTRMHDNPRMGVVDSDCRVHEVANLFIGGSSVFPTGGFANPTLTIVALALRLAAHLKSELQAVPQIQSSKR